MTKNTLYTLYTKQGEPTLEHRFTFRTDFDTADHVIRSARERGVSVSKYINTLLSK